MPSQYSGEVKAQALALMQGGDSAEDAAIKLGLAPRSVQRWAARWRQVSPEQEYPELLSENVRIASRVYGLIHDMIDDLDDLPAGPQRLKHFSQSVIAGGVSFDKVQRAMQGSLHTGSNVQINVIMEIRERLRRELEGKATLVIEGIENGPD